MSHQEKHFSGSETVRDIVIGMSDGLTVPFALAAGLTGAVSQTSIIVTAGLAEIVAGSIAMGLGGYLAGKTEVEHYESELRREYYEVDHFPEIEKREVREVFEEYGLGEKEQDLVVNALAADKDKWVNFMMRYELGLEKPELNRARQSAIAIGGSYIFGGLVPLCPYFFLDDVNKGLIYSCLFTLLCLFVFGYLKSRMMGQPPVKGAFKVALIGALAAGSAYFVGQLIN
jgi:VIT1/CCC1 family predicted Fe2+/Mn2+ transporter